MVLTWSMPVGDESFFWLFFDDEQQSIDELTGTSGSGNSPMRVDAQSLTSTIAGNRRRYSMTVQGLANSADGLMQQHYFAIRANDGCESRVVSAHTRPKPQRLSWPGTDRLTRTLQTTIPQTVNTEAPVGGSASTTNEVGMPPLLVDRGGDETNVSTVQVLKEMDGLEEFVYVARDSQIYVSRNNQGVFDPPLRVSDAGSNSTGEVIRAFSFDNDLDLRPDLFVLTAQRLWVYAADSNPSSSAPVEAQYLNWKKEPLRYIDLPAISTGQFLDAWFGDFDGDGTRDIVTSTGIPQTSTTDGQALQIIIWYGDRDASNNAEWNWAQNPETTIDLNTPFGDDAHFVVGDIDNDGRDDLLTLYHQSSTDLRYRALLSQGRGLPPVTISSGNIAADPNNPQEAQFTKGIESARWDQTALVDLDHDGVLDVLSLRSRSLPAGPIVALRGYRIDLGAGAIATAPPYVDSRLDSTHHTSTNPRQRGHLQVLDLDGDGIQEVLLRSVLSPNGTPFNDSRLTIYQGVRNPQTGLQNWPSIELTPLAVNFERQVNETPHVHFSAADLDFDGVLDFCAVHESQPTSTAVIMASSPDSEFERFSTTPTADRYPLGGTLLTGGNATTIQIGHVAKQGDLVVGFDPTSGVRVLPARQDTGVNNGAFDPMRTVSLQAPLPSLRQFEVVDYPNTNGDILVLLDDGTIGTLEYQPTNDTYAFREETQVAGAMQLHQAYFDRDRRADAIVIDDSNRMHLLSTVDAGGNHNQDLAVRDTVQLTSTPELVHVETISGDAFTEVLVAFKQAGSESRVVRQWKAYRDNGTGKARFATSSTVRTFPSRIVSLATANFRGRFENNLQRRKWLVGGMADGRVLTVRNEETLAIDLPPGLTLPSTGEMVVITADITNDNLPDLIAYERGTSRLFVMRCRPDTNEAWRFPSPGYYQFQASGKFDEPVEVAIPEPLTTLTAGRIDNDPYADLLLLSQDGERVHVLTTRGAQLAR